MWLSNQRGFDFEFASLVFAGTYVEFDDTRRDYGERRIVALGLADAIPFTVVFADGVGPGGVMRRIISARLSNRRSADVMPKSSKTAARKTPTKGRADLARLRRTPDAEIQRTAPAELRDLPDTLWRDARVVTPVTKQAISIRLDQDVLEFLRATGPRYQSHINAVLRSHVNHATSTTQPRRKSAV